MQTKYNKFIYIAFVLIGIIAIIFTKSVGQSIVYLGIALAFDPFDTSLAFPNRPQWQKLTLITHLSIVFGLIFIEIFELLY